MKHFILLFFVLLLAPAVRAQIPVITKKQRVVRSEHYKYNQDSTLRYATAVVYKYSGKRGSQFRIYDYEYIGYGYERFPTLLDPEPVRLPAPFSDIYRCDVAYDTLIDYQDLSDSTLILKKYQTFDDSNILSTYTVDFGDQRQTRYFSRDIFGNLTKVSYVNVFPVLNPIHELKVAYNSMGQVERDTFTRHYTGEFYVRKYSYDTKGRIEGMHYSMQLKDQPMKDMSQEKYSYDDSGRLIRKLVMHTDNMGGWDTSSVYTIAYDAENRIIAYTTYYNTGMPGLSLSHQFYHYNDHGLMDTLAFAMANSAPHGKFVHFYNKMGNPDSSHYYDYTGQGPGMQDPELTRIIHTYETVEDTAWLPEPENTQPLVLYPNPTAGKLTIRWNRELPHRAVYVSVYNAVGQFAKRYHIPDPQNEDTVVLDALAPGVYTVQMVTGSGGLIYTANISLARP